VVRLQQRYQVITGSAWVGGRETGILGGRLRGREIRFHFTADVNGSPVKHQFIGEVEGDTISGTTALSGARLQAKLEWNARRQAGPAASVDEAPARAPGSAAPGTARPDFRSAAYSSVPGGVLN
jgi:hypothetical protein